MTIKERYFTSQSIEHQSAELLRQITTQHRNKEFHFKPVQSALLVLDMQAYFLDASSHAYIPSSDAIIEGIVQLSQAYFTLERPVFFSQHINTASNSGMMATWWKDLITPQSPLHEIIPDLDVAKGTLVQKSQYDAFYQTPLEELLHATGVTQVVLCGVMTHLCCETTARSAFMRGFEVFFPVDGTATYSLEHHRASLLNLAHGFASIVLMKDILDAVRGAHAG